MNVGIIYKHDVVFFFAIKGHRIKFLIIRDLIKGGRLQPLITSLGNHSVRKGVQP